MAGFTKDLSGLVGQLGSAKQEMSEINNIGNTLATTMKSLGAALASSMGSGAGSGGAPGAHTEQAAKDFARSKATPEQLSIMHELVNSNSINNGGLHAGHQFSAKGALHKIGYDAEGHFAPIGTGVGLRDYERAKANAQTWLGQNYTGSASLKDIPRANNLALGADKFASNIQKQAGRFANGNDIEQVTGRVLSTAAENVLSAQKNYKNAVGEHFNSLKSSDVGVQTKAMEELTKAVVNLTGATKEAADASSAAGNGPQGFMSKYGGRIGGALSAGATIAGIAN